jgi:predicted Rossmann fold nucleotide-binding protein DprA/Smf involved in DNA uptake
MDEYWIWLSQIRGLGTVTQKKLINDLGDPSSIYLADKQDLKGLYGIREDVVENIISSRSLKKAHIILGKTIKANIKMITYDNPLLPISVRKNKNTPIILYYLGSIRQDSMGVGIVGARRCTSYGKQVAKEAAAYLAREGITVISGMAKGIDGYAHTACIQEGGYTIALLGLFS